jgi:hypothetical protein
MCRGDGVRRRGRDGDVARGLRIEDLKSTKLNQRKKRG